jgi:hypothetical protein
MGEAGPGQVASGREHYLWQIISSRPQDGKSLGRETDREGGLARGSGVRREVEGRQVSAARPPQLCRVPDYAESNTVLPNLTRGWRTKQSSQFGIAGRELKAFQKCQ